MCVYIITNYMNKTLENHEIIDTVDSEKDENGYFTRTEYIKKENGKMVKRISKIRIYKEIKHIYPKVIERRENWKPFGLAASSNNNITFVSNEDIFMEAPQKDNASEIIYSETESGKCFEPIKEDYRKNFDNRDNKKNDFRKNKEMSSEEFEKFKIERQEKYDKNKKDEKNILMISNLPYGLSPSDFYKMFSPGNVQGIYYNNNIAIIKLKNNEEGKKLVEHSEKHKFGYNHQLVKFQI